ncbi:MAG: ATP-binding protein [Candidatus Methanomethylicaceae archaeon]
MAIGKTSTTRNQPNTSDEFSFWLNPRVNINPTDIVEVRITRRPQGESQDSTESESGELVPERITTPQEQENQVPDNSASSEGHGMLHNNQPPDEERTFGLVTRIENFSDAYSHLDNYISHDFGDVSQTPRTQRIDTNVARCIVMNNTRNIYMPVAGGIDVNFADEEGILTALGIMDVAKANPEFLPLPAGVIELSNGTKCPAIIDARYLIGPEGAHMNISGISGLASKTSYAMFLINMIMQLYGDEVAVIIFNVKHDDLLYVDQRRQDVSPQGQDELWNALSRAGNLLDKQLKPIKPAPFSNVRYFLPRSAQGGANSVSTPSNSLVYAYSLSDISEKISYLFEQVDDPKGNLEALIADIETHLQHGGKLHSYRTFTLLLDYLQQINNSNLRSTPLSSHHLATIRSFIKHFRYFTKSGTTGLFVDKRSHSEVLLSDHVKCIRQGQIYVIDIYKLRDYERGFVVADVVREVYRLFAREISYKDIPPELREQLGSSWQEDDIVEPPKHLIFFIDELNKYAPKGAKMSPVVQNLLEITERGRSLGVSLIGAEQFASDVHSRIIGNCSNKAYGRSDSTELSDEAYRHIPHDLKALITRLDQGTLLLQHPIYRQPVRIRFPLPTYHQPKSKIQLNTVSPDTDLSRGANSSSSDGDTPKEASNE